MVYKEKILITSSDYRYYHDSKRDLSQTQPQIPTHRWNCFLDPTFRCLFGTTEGAWLNLTHESSCQPYLLPALSSSICSASLCSDCNHQVVQVRKLCLIVHAARLSHSLMGHYEILSKNLFLHTCSTCHCTLIIQ